MKNIATTMSVHPEAFTTLNHDREPYCFSMRKVGGRCIFLNGVECTVYSLRPLICRFYPFELKHTRTGSYEFLRTEEDCPGLGKGRPINALFFRKLLAQADEVFSNLGMTA